MRSHLCLQIVFEIPFNSLRKWHLMITKSNEDSKNNNDHISDDDDNSVEYTVMMKGAPEVIIKHCTHIMHASGNEELDDDSIAEFKVLWR